MCNLQRLKVIIDISCLFLKVSLAPRLRQVKDFLLVLQKFLSRKTVIGIQKVCTMILNNQAHDKLSTERL